MRYLIRHLGILWSRGGFGRLQGQIMLDSGLQSTYVYGSVAIADLRTGLRLRDHVLQGSRYFSAEEYPIISFVAYEVVQGNHPSKFIAKGELSLRGITHQLELPFRIVKVIDTPAGKTAYFKSEINLYRRELGIGGSSWSLGNRIRVKIAIEARKS